MSSDLSGLRGIFPPSLRWSAEAGSLAISVFNVETGERELQEIELGKPATFAMDLATRERGYGLIRVGLYDMRLTPVGSPPPPWPDDDEFKPALGCWMWNPTLGEVRFETNAAIAREAMLAVWDAGKDAPEAAAALQPVVQFVSSVAKTIKSVSKTFQSRVIKIIGWVERNQVPGWAEREPTVSPPKALMALPTAAAPAIETQIKKSAKPKPSGKTTIESGRSNRSDNAKSSGVYDDLEKRRPDLKRDPSDDLPF
jgi:hypothetical protein